MHDAGFVAVVRIKRGDRVEGGHAPRGRTGASLFITDLMT